jgi:hypothetical protein
MQESQKIMIGLINIRLINLVFILFLFHLHLSAQSKGTNSAKWEVSFQWEIVKRSSDLYFLSDYIPHEQLELDSSESKPRQNFQSIGIRVYNNLSPKHGIVYENRLKLYGIYEYHFTTPIINGKHDVTGFRTNSLLGDLSASYYYKFDLGKVIKINTRIGPTIFYHYFPAGDSNYYDNFGTSELMQFHKGKPIKFGLNLGAELSIKLGGGGKSFCINSTYYTPFKNDYALIAGIRTIDKKDYWYKWGKKINGLYFGFGFKFPLKSAPN